MATVTDFVKTTSRVTKLDTEKFVISNYIDFAVTGASSGDTVQLLNVSAYDLIERVDVVRVTAEGTASTGCVGDDADIDGYDAGIDLNATTVTRSLEATDAYGVGRYYTADNTIDLLPAQNLSTAAFHVVATGYSLRNI
jgi:hypothetical protein